MANNTDIHDASVLNRFASEQWGRTLAFLRNRFGIAEDDCKDIFQDSFIVLYNNIKDGKLKVMTSSLATYFISICRNKALEFLKASSRGVKVDDEATLSLIDGEIKRDKIENILALEEDDADIQERKEQLVRDIVKNLPCPCNELLWGFYRDNLSMKTLAEMLDYKSESVVKVTKHRCCEKFRARYKELCNKLF